MFLNEDSATHIVESNQANRFELVSNGPISDAVDAIIEVATLSSFEGASATIGESDTDSFRTGWLTFNTVNRFFVYENDATNLTNLNTAATAVIVSTGAVTNSEIARVFVTDNASFSSTQITIGNRARDEMRFGGLLLNSRDSATVFEDDSTVFVGNTSVDELRMNSVGSITDATNAHINVTGAAIFFSETAGIKLGDSATDEFNAGALTLNAVNGVANVTENSDIVLAGNNQARSLVLNAQGTIEDDAFATIDLEFLLSVTATGVDLGETDTDSIGFGSLTCNTSGDTRISSQETMILTGSSVVGGELWLESEGNIFDANAQTTANSAFLTAIDIVLGDSDMDCFDVPPENLVVNASGVANVTIGDC